MAQKPYSQEELKEALEAVEKYGTVSEAARVLGLPRPTLQHRHQAAVAAAKAGETPAKQDESLRSKLQALQAELAATRKKVLDDAFVLREITKLHHLASTAEPPSWLIEPKKARRGPGVPTLLLSDWHWGEVVEPTEVGGVNAYNLEIARNRAKAVIQETVTLLKSHMVTPEYPGIVCALGGDMVSGDIHDELTATNEQSMMPVVVDLYSNLAECITTLANEFGRVFVPAVTGNHGRNTKKMWAKRRNHTSFDWLVYRFLEERFKADPRVTFMVSDGPDALYRVYSHRYLLTHGDQFRGGDGMIGALGPIIRGDHKKRGRNADVGQAYDTLLLGHWHQVIQLRRMIVNGSLIGYNEYANAGNFGFEPPAQALWLTHPEHGITISMPVYADRAPRRRQEEWVSLPK